MKVRELMKILQKTNPDSEVRIWAGDLINALQKTNPDFLVRIWAGYDTPCAIVSVSLAGRDDCSDLDGRVVLLDPGLNDS